MEKGNKVVVIGPVSSNQYGMKGAVEDIRPAKEVYPHLLDKTSNIVTVKLEDGSVRNFQEADLRRVN